MNRKTEGNRVKGIDKSKKENLKRQTKEQICKSVQHTLPENVVLISYMCSFEPRQKAFFCGHFFIWTTKAFYDYLIMFSFFRDTWAGFVKGLLQ